MSRRKRETESGWGRLLDCWEAPSEAGPPIGCVTTTYELQPEFFEEQCLASFAGIESHPRDETPLFLIEREEKLRALSCASVLVDALHCWGERSLHWDMIPARAGSARQHAKVSLLLWQRHARLVVASANLTETGYRRNREVFGVLDYFDGSEAPLDCLRDVSSFLAEAAGGASLPPEERGDELDRWHRFLDRVRETTATWGRPSAPRGKSGVRVHPVLVGPGRPSLLEQVKDLFPRRPRDAWVVSPFFDRPGGRNRPAEQIWELLALRGEAEVCYQLEVDEVPGTDRLLLRAPQSLETTRPDRSEASVRIHRLSRRREDEGRKLHMKGMWLQGGGWGGYLMGSSNFTTRGLGLSRPNLEANLLYLVHEQAEGAAFQALDAAFPDSEPLPEGAQLEWQPPKSSEDDEEEPEGWLPLPPFFAQASFHRTATGDAHVELRFDVASTPPEGWSAKAEKGQHLSLTEAEWAAQGRSAQLRVPWPSELGPPSGLEITRAGDPRSSWWPVQLATGAVLPAPDELRRLTLDELLDVLTSARPLHEVLRRHLKARRADDASDDAEANAVTDPHARVQRDAAGFLLNRTRRVSWALAGLRARLERPVATLEALRWRLRGPVGALRLGELLLNAAKSPEEAAFLRAELALELARVRPQQGLGGVPAGIVRSEVQAAIAELQGGADPSLLDAQPDLSSYVAAAFAEAQQ